MKAYKRLRNDKQKKNSWLAKLLIGIITFAVLFLLCAANIIPHKYNLKEGDIAPEDISAPRDIVDEAETQNKIEQATTGQDLTQYTVDENVLKGANKKLNSFYELLKQTRASSGSYEEKASAVKANGLVSLDGDEVSEILTESDETLQEFFDFMNKTVEKILEQGIREDKEDDLKEAQSDLNYYIQNSSLSRITKDIANNIGITLIKPNKMVDDEKTGDYLESLKKEVGEVVIKKDQNIVLKGEAITQSDIDLMSALGLLQDGESTDIKLYIGIAVTLVFTLGIIGLYLYRFDNAVYKDNSRLAIIALIICLNAGFATGIYIISPYLIPFALLSILITVIFDKNLALALSIPVFIIIGLLTNFNFEYLMIYVLSCIGGVVFIKNIHQRSSILVDGLCVGMLNSIMIVTVGLINTDGILQNLKNGGICFLGGILAAILAIGILPVIESIFDIITPVKLLELSNPNQPLLKKLLYEAPGTYHHSILVANLSEAAAEEIGANALLARVGAYYHDIGKIKRPYFFKENQIINDNPHDKITPKLSTVIITSHVRDGIDMAKEYKLPEAIRDIIQQHHGDTLVKYFYVMAKNDEGDSVEDSAFRYDGPKPQTREAAIVMLADSVEAAVRSLSNPSVDEISKMVDKIVKDKIDDMQLDCCAITMRDIVQIRSSFKLVLEGIFHNRIEYPELNSSDGSKENTDDRN